MSDNPLGEAITREEMAEEVRRRNERMRNANTLDETRRELGEQYFTGPMFSDRIKDHSLVLDIKELALTGVSAAGLITTWPAAWYHDSGVESIGLFCMAVSALLNGWGRK